MSTRSETPCSSGVPRPCSPDEPDRVRVVDHHHGVVALGELADLTQRRHVAVHREHAVGRDEPPPGAGSLLQQLLEVRHVAVAVPVALCGAEPDAVDDGGVVELVARYRVLLVEQGLEQPSVGVEARRVKDRVLGPKELRHSLLEVLVDLLGAADEAHACHPVAPPVQRLPGSGHHPRVVGEPEVVVGAQVEDLAAVGDGHRRLLGRDDHPLGLVEPLGPDLLELSAQLVADLFEHGPPIRPRTRRARPCRNGRRARRRRPARSRPRRSGG